MVNIKKTKVKKVNNKKLSKLKNNKILNLKGGNDNDFDKYLEKIYNAINNKNVLSNALKKGENKIFNGFKNNDYINSSLPININNSEEFKSQFQDLEYFRNNNQNQVYKNIFFNEICDKLNICLIRIEKRLLRYEYSTVYTYNLIKNNQEVITKILIYEDDENKDSESYCLKLFDLFEKNIIVDKSNIIIDKELQYSLFNIMYNYHLNNSKSIEILDDINLISKFFKSNDEISFITKFLTYLNIEFEPTNNNQRNNSLLNNNSNNNRVNTKVYINYNLEKNINISENINFVIGKENNNFFIYIKLNNRIFRISFIEFEYEIIEYGGNIIQLVSNNEIILLYSDNINNNNLIRNNNPYLIPREIINIDNNILVSLLYFLFHQDHYYQDILNLNLENINKLINNEINNINSLTLNKSLYFFENIHFNLTFNNHKIIKFDKLSKNKIFDFFKVKKKFTSFLDEECLTLMKKEGGYIKKLYMIENKEYIKIGKNIIQFKQEFENESEENPIIFQDYKNSKIFNNKEDKTENNDNNNSNHNNDNQIIENNEYEIYKKLFNQYKNKNLSLDKKNILNLKKKILPNQTLSENDASEVIVKLIDYIKDNYDGLKEILHIENNIIYKKNNININNQQQTDTILELTMNDINQENNIDEIFNDPFTYTFPKSTMNQYRNYSNVQKIESVEWTSEYLIINTNYDSMSKNTFKNQFMKKKEQIMNLLINDKLICIIFKSGDINSGHYVNVIKKNNKYHLINDKNIDKYDINNENIEKYQNNIENLLEYLLNENFYPYVYLYKKTKPASNIDLKGITNHGNTCFLNAALQLLFQIPELNDLKFKELVGGFEPEANNSNEEDEINNHFKRIEIGYNKYFSILSKNKINNEINNEINDELISLGSLYHQFIGYNNKKINEIENIYKLDKDNNSLDKFTKKFQNFIKNKKNNDDILKLEDIESYIEGLINNNSSKVSTPISKSRPKLNLQKIKRIKKLFSSITHAGKSFIKKSRLGKLFEFGRKMSSKPSNKGKKNNEIIKKSVKIQFRKISEKEKLVKKHIKVQVIHLAKIMKNFNLNDNFEGNNQQKVEYVLNEINKLNLIKDFSKNMYNLFKLKNDDNKNLKFKLTKKKNINYYIKYKDKDDYYFNLHLFNMAMNNKLNKKKINNEDYIGFF